jgi:hypothetical protein
MTRARHRGLRALARVAALTTVTRLPVRRAALSARSAAADSIASTPGNSTYYTSADAFCNNGTLYGSLVGTPFASPGVPAC